MLMVHHAPLGERAARVQLAVAALHHGLAWHVAANARRIQMVKVPARRTDIHLVRESAFEIHAVLRHRSHRRDHTILHHADTGVDRASIPIASDVQRPQVRSRLTGRQGRGNTLGITTIAVEYTQLYRGGDRQRVTASKGASVQPGRRGSATTLELDVDAPVERLIRVRALSGVVDNVRAGALGQRTVQLVGAIGRERRLLTPPRP